MNVYSPVMADATLDDITAQARAIEQAIIRLYETIRAAKDRDYSYNELQAATGFPRGTMQNIVAGQNPRYSVE